MTLTVILIDTACLIPLLYLTTILLLSKKTSLQTPFFIVNKHFNVLVCILTFMIIADFAMAEGYLACPCVILFTLFKYVMNTVVTALAVTMCRMVFIRYTIVTSAQITHNKKCALLKFFVVLWTISPTVAIPVLFVEFRYDENLNYFISDRKSIPFLTFDILEGLCTTICFTLNVYFTLRTAWFMSVHNKPWNLFFAHILLSTFYPLIFIPFQWSRIYWRLFDCDFCMTYVNILRSFAVSATLTITFSIVICSKEVREEVLYPLAICQKLPVFRKHQNSKISGTTTMAPSVYLVTSQGRTTKL